MSGEVSIEEALGAALRVLAGEAVGSVAAALGRTAEEVAGWVERLDGGGTAALEQPGPYRVTDEESFREAFVNCFEGLFMVDIDPARWASDLRGSGLVANAALLTLMHARDFAALEAHQSSVGLVDRADPVFTALLAENVRSRHARGRLTLVRLDGERVLADVASRIYATPEGGLRAARVYTAASATPSDDGRGEFVATVSHELRTPLASIRGSLGLIEGGVAGAIDAEAMALVRVARANCERLIRLVNEMLDLEKTSAGKSELELSLLDPAGLVDAALAASAELAARHQVSLTRELEPSPPIVGDRGRLVQALELLLGNAIAHAPAHSTVCVALRATPETVLLEVCDSGAPLGSPGRPALWGPAPGGPPEPFAGWLSLLLVRTIIEQHGGAVSAGGEARGVRLRIELPLSAAPAHEAGPLALVVCAERRTSALIDDVLELEGFTPVGLDSGAAASAIAEVRPVRLVVADAAQARGAASAGCATVVLGGEAAPGGGVVALALPVQREPLRAAVRHALRAAPVRILVVDGDDDTRLVVSAALRPLGNCYDAASVERGVRLARSVAPALAVLDVSMFGNTPEEILDRLRAAGLGDAALLVYTRMDLTDAERARLQLGPTAYAVKTLTPAEALPDVARRLLAERDRLGVRR